MFWDFLFLFFAASASKQQCYHVHHTRDTTAVHSWAATSWCCS